MQFIYNLNSFPIGLNRLKQLLLVSFIGTMLLFPSQAKAIYFEESAFDPNSNEPSLVSTETELGTQRLHNARNGFGGGVGFGYSPNSYQNPNLNGFGSLLLFMEKRIHGIVGIQGGFNFDMGFKVSSDTSSSSNSNKPTTNGVNASTSTSTTTPDPFMFGFGAYIAIPVYPLLFGNWSLSIGPKLSYNLRMYSFSDYTTPSFTMSQSSVGLMAALQWKMLMFRVARETYSDTTANFSNSSGSTTALSPLAVQGSTVNSFAFMVVFGF